MVAETECDGFSSLKRPAWSTIVRKTWMEAAWDLAGVPRNTRLLIKEENESEQNEESEEKLKASGWRYIGYKPGKDYECSEDTAKYGQRVVLCGFGAWEEPRRRSTQKK